MSDGTTTRVELIAIGDELLSGVVTNGNAAWLGQALAAAGYTVCRAVVVDDTRAEIVAALRDAFGRADAVLVTGGLGPTSDDRTREALAEFAGVRLCRDPDAERRIRDYYAAPGRPRMRAESVRMADVPEGATILANPVGSAPGLCLARPDGRVGYALPGVPAEMRAMARAAVLPDLARRAGRPEAVRTRTVHTALAYESGVAERLRPLEAELDAAGHDVTLAYLAAPGRVRVRCTVHAPDAATAENRLAEVESRVRDLLGGVVFGVDDATLDGVVHRLLAERSATVAAAESLTGGLIGAALTAMPGSSATFRGGMVTYATDLKAAELGVSRALLAEHGAVHPRVAGAMAEGVAARLGADYGIAVTGVAGPQPQDGRPVGTVHIAVAATHGADMSDTGRRPDVRVHSPLLAGSRETIRELTVVHALDLLRRRLLGWPPFVDWEEVS